MTSGTSTWVFRVQYRRDIFYLRILPEVGASFAPEVAAHRELWRRGVRVPEVIAYIDCDEAVQRSIMLTTAIVGKPVSAAHTARTAHATFVAAGRDLARLNSIPVIGFGWVKRDQPGIAQLRAEWPTQRAFVLAQWDADLTLLVREELTSGEIAALHRVLTSHMGWLDATEAMLAHGDFDTTHIFQAQGSYTGIIDLGEIRGADWWYDLGYFHLHDGERLPYAALPDLLCGYGEIMALPPNVEQRIHFAALLIAVRTLAHYRSKRPADRHTAFLLQMLRTNLVSLR